MSLKTFLFALPMPERHAFAERCGTSYPHIRNIAYGQKPCGEGLAVNIERESRGAVRCESLRPDVDWGYLRGTARSPRDPHKAAA
jgi:DNA-binding transcriptional regulator YdaS (Cro superfamily)